MCHIQDALITDISPWAIFPDLSAYTSNPVPALPVLLEYIGWRQLLIFPMEYAN